MSSSVLFRTGSGPINSSLLPGAPRFTVPHRHDSFSSCEKYEFSSNLLHLEVNNNRGRRISRSISEPHALIRLRSITSGPHSTFPNMLPEVDEDVVVDHSTVGSLKFAKKCFDSGSGRDGFGSRPTFGGSNDKNNDNDNEEKKIDAHYKKMLKSNPNDPLILRNYGKFLHEVEGDSVKAKECYERAILASPAGDGELLALYGKLIWDTQRDGERAQSYFDQALIASPHDCMVMGSYAQFMWEAEEDEDEEELGCDKQVLVPGAQSMVAAAY